MNRLLFFFYKFLIMPFAYLLLQILRPLAKGKLREMIGDKNQNFAVINNKRIFSQRPVWIHAASGEIEYARSLIRELQLQDPDLPILITYSSPSAKTILRHLKVDAWAALPWDIDFCFERFFKYWNPRALLVSRTDLWPVMADFTFHKNIPSYLFSATFADNSSRLKGFTKYLTAYSLSCLQAIFCVSDEDKKNLEILKIKTPVSVLGDTRFDQVFFRLTNAQNIKTSLQPNFFTFVMGSTWPEDEKVLILAIRELKDQPIRFIIAPHEISAEHLEKLENAFAREKISFFRYSQTQKPEWKNHNVLIIDQVGILAEIYTWGNVAFVGGSFKKQVHSVMEPLAAGLPVLVGPLHANNREALAYQREHVDEIPLVLPVNNANEIVLFIESLMKKPSGVLQKSIFQRLQKNAGSTKKLISKIKSALYTLPDPRS